MRRDRGTTLIFVLGILALLSLFAISFASVTRVERTAAGNYVDSMRADLAARSGIAAGVAAAHEEFRQPSPGNTTLGGYLDPVHVILAVNGKQLTMGSVLGIAPGDQVSLRGGSTPEEIVTVDPAWVQGTNPLRILSTPGPGRNVLVPRGANWYYHGHNQNPVTTGNGIPVALSLTMASGTTPGYGVPSLRLPTCQQFQATSTLRLVSGSTGGRYFTADPTLAANKGTICGFDVYGVKILDSQGMLDANMDQAELTTILNGAFGQDVLDELKSISNALSSSIPAINNYIPLNDAAGNAYQNPFKFASNVSAFINYRKNLSGGKFRSKEQLKGAFYAMTTPVDTTPPAQADAWFALYRDYFTCYGDYEGNDTFGDDGSPGPGGGFPIAGGMPNQDLTAPFQQALQNVRRMAVDVNTAPYPVLVAVLSTCRARTTPVVGTDPAAGPVTVSIGGGALTPMSPYTAGGGMQSLTRAEAQQIAGALVKMRPFRSWQEVYRALCTLKGTTPDATLSAAIVATCPVELPLSMNPDRDLFWWDTVDPEDTAQTSKAFPVTSEKATSHSCADFCFTSGYFEVESLGRIYANPTQPYIVSESHKRAVVNVGGFAWVRGQKDLSSQGNGSLMGAPSTDPNLSWTGGWVQPIPAFQGIQLPGGTSIASNGGLGAWQQNTQDGLIVQRNEWVTTNKADVLIVHAQTSPNLANNVPGFGGADQGRAEMWVKMPNDSTQGTNEALFMNLRVYNPGLRHSEFDTFSTGPAGGLALGGGDAADIVITQMGVATRLERFGNQLYFCRFFWGYPDGASAPTNGEFTASFGIASPGNNPLIPYGAGMHAYITAPTGGLNWKAGTWHHVAITWNVMDMHLYVDGVDQGAPTIPNTFQGGAVFAKTVQGFWPNQGTGGLDPNNQFANLPRNSANDAMVGGQESAAQSEITALNAEVTALNGDITALNADIATQQAIAANPSSTPAQVTAANNKISQDQNQITTDQNKIAADQAKIAQDQKLVNDANAWFLGGNGRGNFATDVLGDTFTAELGLRRMKLRTHTPIPGLVDIVNGTSESYFLGYTTPDPPPNDGPPTIVTLNFSFGAPGNSNYKRYCNGTFDGLTWMQAPTFGAPTPTPHRYNVDPLSYSLQIGIPDGAKAVAHGYHVICAHGLYQMPDPVAHTDLMGGGTTVNMAETISGAGNLVTMTKSFPAGNTPCNVSEHQSYCNTPGSNEVPWAISGLWLAFEKPTTFLEAEEVD